jgi:hypothetical protein
MLCFFRQPLTACHGSGCEWLATQVATSALHIITSSAEAARPYHGAVTTSLLLCNDPLRPAHCDPYFAPHAAAAREAGAEVALLDHDALLLGHTDEAVRRVPHGLGALWYRGWMIPAAAYGELNAVLARRGAHLLTTPMAYRAAHELPVWYTTLAEATPASTWIPWQPGSAPGPQALARAAADLPAGPGIVKDFVKSRKHEWEEACYLPDLANTPAVHAVVSRFVELQEDSLAGGIVLRAFEDLRRDVGEARVWWLDGEAVLTTGHPDTPDLRPTPVLDHIQPLVRRLGCRFITTDLAQRTDGTWRVIEVGDGQVSDLANSADPAALLEPLLTLDRITEEQEPPTDTPTKAAAPWSGQSKP